MCNMNSKLVLILHWVFKEKYLKSLYVLQDWKMNPHSENSQLDKNQVYGFTDTDSAD